ncbi:MAG: threonine synthase [Pseudomonadota bacterium]
MQFQSTRGAGPIELADAIAQGLATDGGLYVPVAFPKHDAEDFDPKASLAAVATQLLTPFFAGDRLADELSAICSEALNFPTPIVATANPDLKLLELFHGPTAAFKDVGARFLAAALSRLTGEVRPTVMVATSGDTGGAVAAACAEREGLRVVVLYPEGGVSERQEHQLTCFGDNVLALRVRGAFDDCQRLVKQAFGDAEFQAKCPLTSANSISVARLLPQMSYYAAASLKLQASTGRPANFVVPTGNLGNALAGIWARRCGMPIERIHLATNANTVIPRFLESGAWDPEDTVATLASAMDVGDPSNMERLRHLHPAHDDLSRQVTASASSDEDIRHTITWAFKELELEICPHTATALHALADLPEDRSWLALATAHAAKFEGIVEPLIGKTVAVPPALAELLERPTHKTDVNPDLAEVRRAVLGWRGV